MNQEFGISKCKLLYIEQINGKVPLYNMGIQYPMRNHNEKDHVRECVCVCVCITELLCCTEIYMQINYTSIKCFLKNQSLNLQTSEHYVLLKQFGPNKNDF